MVRLLLMPYRQSLQGSRLTFDEGPATFIPEVGNDYGVLFAYKVQEFHSFSDIGEDLVGLRTILLSVVNAEGVRGGGEHLEGVEVAHGGLRCFAGVSITHCI
jgi:hypothetical protein